MAGQPVTIGPFFGGLNTMNDPSTIEDVQCAVLDNFDIDTDGSIVARPAIGYSEHVAYDVRLLTFYTHGDQIYAIVARRGGVGGGGAIEWLTAIDIDTNIQTNIKSSEGLAQFSSAVQYDGKLWYSISEGSTTTGGSWVPGTQTDVKSMPKGSFLLVYKERLFLASKCRVYFSKIADPTDWTVGSEAGGFFDVGSGDGQHVNSMISHMGQIVLFKDHSTYVFAYENSPDRAVIQMVSNTIGAEAAESVVTYEGIIYTVHHNKVYAINNWRWVDVSERILIHDPPSNPEGPDRYRSGESSLSVVGRRIILRYRTKYFVYFPDLESWSTWSMQDSGKIPDYWKQVPRMNAHGYYEYWAGCRNNNLLSTTSNKIWRLVDGYSIDHAFADDFVATVGTKMYDYELPYSFKRLHWWGLDIRTTSTITAKVYPQTYNTQATWNDLRHLTWDQAKGEGRTWDRPVDISIDVTDSATMGYIGGARTFMKFLKSLRFRKASFEISYRYNHEIQREPLRIFSAMAVISAKQLLPKKSN